jgi:hypothetical protein
MKILRRLLGILVMIAGILGLVLSLAGLVGYGSSSLIASAIRSTISTLFQRGRSLQAMDITNQALGATVDIDALSLCWAHGCFRR